MKDSGLPIFVEIRKGYVVDARNIESITVTQRSGGDSVYIQMGDRGFCNFLPEEGKTAEDTVSCLLKTIDDKIEKIFFDKQRRQ